jgi:hypothetical protein
MAWPSVKTTITPSHYAYIAVSLCSVFPPEVAELITRLTKNCDEEQNLREHMMMSEYGYIMNNLVNNTSDLIYYCKNSVKELYSFRTNLTSPKTMDLKKCLTGRIQKIGDGINFPQGPWFIPHPQGPWFIPHPQAPQAPPADNKTVSERMIKKIKAENLWYHRWRSSNVWNYTAGSGKSAFEILFAEITNSIKQEGEKDYKKIAKKEKRKRNKMLKLQTPKQKMKFSKNQPRYNNRRIR